MTTIKKLTLMAIIIFIIVVGIISIGNYYVSQNNFQNSENAKPLLQSDINSPNINISKLLFSPENTTTDSFTFAEVSTHNSRHSCYLVINNNVYDVSSYISYHPAGSKKITSRCGKEVTGIFAEIHSNKAWDLLKKYKIGIIVTNK